MRIGHGYDVHAFTDGDGLWLGGVRIEHDQGVAAHSDGDVVLHALMDALLGAAGLGDIGQHFPNRDARYRGAASGDLLQDVLEKIRAQNLRVVNVDVTVIAQAPQLGPHREAMGRSMAQLLQLDEGRVNLKATTHEGLGALGRGEGIAVHAVALLEDAG
ncbi:MAG: 2-C-methyl-D-erythritol 2,4-cyclodiphosphate synthase [Gammaproteobacteria bacterium]|nr:2-C-methyl-D-erythritol 2,4-cyclodiphosphate synthase [Gammaproteobacteria bacterium]